jgi:hypothetical protein
MFVSHLYDSPRSLGNTLYTEAKLCSLYLTPIKEKMKGAHASLSYITLCAPSVSKEASPNDKTKKN